MFTGLVEELGEVISLAKKSEGLQIGIRCKRILEDIKIGDSISTNGVCLTAVEIGSNYFIADCMFETLDRSSIKILKKGDRVNLERALTLNSRLGGHIVTGDVECLGEIISIFSMGIAKVYTFSVPAKYSRYIIEKGRITIDGASLTVMEAEGKNFSVSLIPHTQKMITLGYKSIGDVVNIETDIIGKYIERF
ncbi:MAG: riboflavin synthase, partial [Fusobacteriaceae bacterium]